MKNAQNFFDEYAYSFDALYGVPNNVLNFIVNPLFRKSMKLRFIKTMQYSEPIEGKSFFDIGCGPGHYSVALAKAGAAKVVGIDFSEEMIKIAESRAAKENASNICEFQVIDIMDHLTPQKFDHSILMGFMDYVKVPEIIISKVIQVTKKSMFISFPNKNGFLAFQRKVRYKKRCPLFLYSEQDLIRLGNQFSPWNFTIEKISRDYFFTLSTREPRDE